MHNLTFKQYLDSKAHLIKSLGNTPIVVQEYTVRNYCSITLGEYDDDKVTVTLKPKNKVIVEWQYDSIECPSPVSIRLESRDVSESETFATSWSSVKLKKWLHNHTKELESPHHIINTLTLPR
jgi:hypothetical protein